MASSILAAAIDFGTTYSGCAYSFEHQYKQDPTKVFAKLWSGGMLMSDKAPTTVLIAPDGKTFKAFGYEAEDKYAELAVKKEHKKWFYFSRFKMLLMDKTGLERGFQMEDETGKKLLAKTVFSMAIKYLKDNLLEECKTRIAGMILPDDIMWVLTVPAIWNDSAKQFMREAAVEAGINTDKLKLALEPEAASLFCRLLPIDRMTRDTDISRIKAGSKYMVLDAGGGTVDITVHQVLQEGRLKEIHEASGGAWGGTNVDEAFRQFLISIVGNPVFQKFREEYMDDYLDMTRDFEIKKRKVEPEPDSNDKKNENEKKYDVVIRFPLTLKELFEIETGEDLQASIEQTRHAGQVELDRDKLKVDARIMRSFFEEPVRRIIDHVNMLFTKPDVVDVPKILMIGGFSDSKMLQYAIQKEFGRKHVTVTVPHEPGIVVLKGAVVFGHDTGTISARIAKYTYGVAKRMNFIEGKHDERHKIVDDDGIIRCKNLFGKFVEIGQSLKCKESFQYEYKSPDSKATSFEVQLFASTNKHPKYVTDVGCYKVGMMNVYVDTSVPYNDRRFVISLSFGDTEIHVKALEKSTGKETLCSFNCMD